MGFFESIWAGIGAAIYVLLHYIVCAILAFVICAIFIGIIVLLCTFKFLLFPFLLILILIIYFSYR